ncbi:MAG TPA: hypothetical protein VMT04_10160 [Terriglobales bacterium]|nr:hypothetical protein [Terriglobales bacterium]
MPFPRKRWIEIAKARGLERVQVKLIRKIGKCPHEKGEVFVYVHPNCRPEGLCGAAAISLEPFVMRCSAKIPSSEKDNPKIYRIHCPSKKGTIWEIKRIK